MITNRLSLSERRILESHGLTSLYTRIALKSDQRPIYKFVKSESHANAMESGWFFISTLDTCRKYEEPGRGDLGEGAFEMRTTTVESRVQYRDASRESILTTRTSVTQPYTTQDCYIFCTTSSYNYESMSKQFGEFCVRINNPALFCTLLGASISGTKLERSIIDAGPVGYMEKTICSVETRPSFDPIFTKHPDFAQQNEYRLMVMPAGDAHKCEPFEICTKLCGSLVQRIR